MRIVDFVERMADPIQLFDSVACSSIELGHGRGEAHVYCVYIDAGGRIGAHPTEFCQLFLIIAGSGWVEGGDGRRVELVAGQGAFLDRGEMHSKGSDAGLTAIMVQVAVLEPEVTLPS